MRAAEPLGFDAELWERLAATGVVGMAVPEDRGGSGAGLANLVLVAQGVRGGAWPQFRLLNRQSRPGF